MEIQVPVQEFTDGAHKWQREVLEDFDSQKARFFMLNWHRRARKTTLAINLLIRECVRNPKSRYVYVTSTFVAAKNIVWRDPNMLKKYLPEVCVAKKNETELYVEFVNGAILSIHGSDKPDSLRGIDACGVVIDEWAMVKKEVWEEILRPIIAQNPKRWAMFIFTPKGRNHAFTYWGRATEDSKLWRRYDLKASESGIIPKEELELLEKELPRATFDQEIECAFNDSAANVFKGIEGCFFGELEKAPKVGYSYVTGVDLAKSEDYTVLVTMNREEKRVVSFERFNQIEWGVQKERIIAHCQRWRSQAIIDSTGLGDPITEDIMRSGIGVRAFKITGQSKKELIDRLSVAIEQTLIRYPDIPVMTDELRNYGYDLTTHGNVRYSAPSGMHDDTVIALALAVWGLKGYLYQTKEPVNRVRRYEKYYANQTVNCGFGF